MHHWEQPPLRRYHLNSTHQPRRLGCRGCQRSGAPSRTGSSPPWPKLREEGWMERVEAAVGDSGGLWEEWFQRGASRHL
uniref:Eno2 n=1 Tax=Arundo donax TaxID=35708 RepID=A0A0A9G9G3_ARUDO